MEAHGIKNCEFMMVDQGVDMLSCDDGTIVQRLSNSNQLFKYKISNDILKEAEGQKLKFFPNDKMVLMLAKTKNYALISQDEKTSEIAYVTSIQNQSGDIINMELTHDKKHLILTIKNANDDFQLSSITLN